MDGILERFVPVGLVISLFLLFLGLTMEGLAGPYSLWGVGTWTTFAGVMGTGMLGGFFVGMIFDAS